METTQVPTNEQLESASRAALQVNRAAATKAAVNATVERLRAAPPALPVERRATSDPVACIACGVILGAALWMMIAFVVGIAVHVLR